jgi:hypothetical protein
LGLRGRHDDCLKAVLKAAFQGFQPRRIDAVIVCQNYFQTSLPPAVMTISSMGIFD